MMTEAEIRNDERRKIVATLEWFKPYYRNSSGAFELVIALCTPKPLPPEPDTQKWWHGFSWGDCEWKTENLPRCDKTAKFAKPPKDWRDVPVTAGMLYDVYKRASPDSNFQRAIVEAANGAGFRKAWP